MLLRRITEHVKAQNWTAVALDFVIVVVGVFMGIQVSNWNSLVSQDRMLDRRLAALELDMNENLSRLDDYAEEMIRGAEAASRLRALLGSENPGASATEVDQLILGSFGLPALSLHMGAYDDLKASGNILLLVDTPARDDLARWEASLTMLKRIENDVLEIRNNIMHSYFVENTVFAAAAEHYGFDPKLLAQSRFRNDPDAMAVDPTFDSVLAIIILMRGATVEEVKKVQASTRALIETLEVRQ